MRTICLSLAAASIALAAAQVAVAQQTPDVLLHQDFEGPLTGWTTMGAGGALRIVNGPGQAHNGNGALAFSYEIKPRQAAMAILPTASPGAPALARMQKLDFWLKIDHASPVAVLLSEQKPGGNYVAWFWPQANVWQELELTLADFILSDGPNDPKDPDGKLDLDQVQGIGIFDLGSFFPLGAPIAPGSSQGGGHTLWIDDFDVLAGPPPAATGMRIDSFDRGLLSWIATGGAELKLATAANPLGEPAMQATYEQTEEPFPSLVRRLGNADLSKATRLDFDIASEQEATIAIGLELKRPGFPQGPRFNLPVYPPGKREVFHVSVKLEDFQGQGKLDPALLKTLSLTDASAAGSGSTGRNTIWIGKLEFR